MLVAAEKGDVETVRALILDAGGALPIPSQCALNLINARDSDGYSPLHRAAYGGHLEVVQVGLFSCTRK